MSTDAALAGMRVGVTGSSGLVGSALVDHLRGHGATCARFIRGVTSLSGNDRSWNPNACVDGTPLPLVDGLDAVVHLAGASVASQRWSRRRKTEVRESRVHSTRTLALALARAKVRPATLVCASGIGYYGDCGDQPVDESSAAGSGFLAEVVREWEAAAEPAREAGVRVVHARFGVILTTRGGALHRMLPAFRLGLGGPIGSGRQGFSWISLDDAIGAVSYFLHDTRAEGAINVVANAACSQREFARALGAVLHRWAMLRAPAPIVRLALGEMGDELLLRGAFVQPRRLRELGYSFQHPTLRGALSSLIAFSGRNGA